LGDIISAGYSMSRFGGGASTAEPAEGIFFLIIEEFLQKDEL